MTEVGVRALKQNASAVVAAAAAGEVVTVTDRGRPTALLSPIPATRLGTLRVTGQARSPRRPGGIAALPEPAIDPCVDLTAALLEARGDERY